MEPCPVASRLNGSLGSCTIVGSKGWKPTELTETGELSKQEEYPRRPPCHRKHMCTPRSELLLRGFMKEEEECRQLNEHGSVLNYLRSMGGFMEEVRRVVEGTLAGKARLGAMYHRILPDCDSPCMFSTRNCRHSYTSSASGCSQSSAL